jgi:hypothetical protein
VAEAAQQPNRERSSIGICRRHAPPTQTTDQKSATPLYPSWVTMSADDWCGEHAHVNAGS